MSFEKELLLSKPSITYLQQPRAPEEEGKPDNGRNLVGEHETGKE